MMTFQSYAADTAAGELKLSSLNASSLKPDEVDIAVDYCGLCHSDLSMLNNDWQMSAYPLVPGHEVVGTVREKGEAVTHLKVGQKVGLGWFSRSCGTCPSCLAGDQNLCASVEATIGGRTGGFAEVVRAQALWAGCDRLLGGGPTLLRRYYRI